MPITINTSSGAQYSEVFYNTMLNMVMAVSKSMGSDYHVISDTDANKQYFIPTDAIGYPGLGIFFEAIAGTAASKNAIYRCGIFNASPDGISPDISEGLANISHDHVGYSADMGNTIEGSPETCVMICDESKDTVLFDIHPGKTINGVDLSFDDHASERARRSFTLFFAKDVNGGFLCGIGSGHIASMRTMTSKLDADENMASAQEYRENDSLLQLTKMVNYLDPGCPEMKSAYVSVFRPLEAIIDKLYVSALYADGKRWWRAGLLDSWPDTYNTSEYPICPAFFPIEPFVNC